MQYIPSTGKSFSSVLEPRPAQAPHHLLSGSKAVVKSKTGNHLE
jgi:hypothetical protein